MTDSLLGPAYMTADDFVGRAAVFGCGGPVIAAFNGDEIETVLSAASRAIEGYTNRSFNINPQTETQHVDLYSRRIRVDKSPVASIVSATLQTYPTPTTLDFTQWRINNAENYIELPSSQVGNNNSFSVNVAEYPDITIVYNTAQAMPPVAVLNAVGFVAADLLNRDYVNRLIPTGITEITTGKQTIQKAQFNPEIKSIPEIARQILANDTSISPRMVPKGYPSRYLRSGPQFRVP